MTSTFDFEFERKFTVLADTTFPIENGSYIFQGFPYIGNECTVRVRMEAAIESVCRIQEESCLNLRSSDGLLQLLTNVDCNEEGLLTIKETGGGRSGVRYEKEVSISSEVVKSILMDLACRNPSSVVLKRRYSHITSFDDRTWSWEIDVFEGANAPLLLAECEDAEPVADLWIPNFCHREVTGDIRFTNAYLATHPFSSWSDSSMFLSGPTFSDEFGTNTFESGGSD